MGEFLGGIVSIAFISAIIVLLFPNGKEDDFLPIVKLAMGIWIIRTVFSIFGHSLS